MQRSFPLFFPFFFFPYIPLLFLIGPRLGSTPFLLTVPTAALVLQASTLCLFPPFPPLRYVTHFIFFSLFLPPHGVCAHAVDLLRVIRPPRRLPDGLPRATRANRAPLSYFS